MKIEKYTPDYFDIETSSHIDVKTVPQYLEKFKFAEGYRGFTIPNIKAGQIVDLEITHSDGTVTKIPSIGITQDYILDKSSFDSFKVCSNYKFKLYPPSIRETVEVWKL